jgi:hypothetical protein
MNTMAPLSRSAAVSRLAPALSVAALAFAPHAVAQSHTVSPPGFATQAGNVSNTYPFFEASARHQQVHGDVRTPLALTALALRQAKWPVRSMPARTLDAELWIGVGNQSAMTTTFAANFTAPPVAAMQRRSVQLPDWSQAPVSSPAPWTAVFPFDQPTPFPGGGDLVWDLRIHQTTHAGFYWTDAYMAEATAEGPGGPVGTGCTATGMNSPAELNVSLQAQRATNQFGIDAGGLYWPPSQPGVLLIGVQDPNVTLPGLCAAIRVVPLIDVHLTIAGRGNLTPPVMTFGFDPGAIGLRLHLQAAALDPGRPGLPLVVSHGWSGTLPDLPPVGHPIRRLQAPSVTATTGTLDVVSYGLITRFSH